MFSKGRISLILLGLCVLVLCASYSLAKEDPELRQCKHQCRHQKQFDEKQIKHCETSCEDYIKQKEKYKEGESNSGRRVEEEYKECRERCQEKGQGRREEQLCESKCESSRKRQQERGSSGDEYLYRRDEGQQEWGEETTSREGSGYPYVFGDSDFSTKFKTREGSVRVLEKFSERTDLFNGIDNFRVLIFQANPQTFILPSHWDADLVFFVARGEGTIHLVFTDKRESFNIEGGHVMVVPAGVTAYMVNRNNTENLVLVKIVNPVSNTGEFMPFFGSGGRDPQSFFNAFSSEILEAVFKAPRERIQRIFSQQREGVIVRASEEQIRSMTTHEKTRVWPFGEKTSREFAPLQLFNQTPKEANAFGQLFEDKNYLKHLNMAISFANITEGSMHTPHYNTRATKIAVVVKGTGYFEMACPHVSSSGSGSGHDHRREQQRDYSRRSTEESTPVEYERISSELEQGMVFIVPAGHPFVTVASENDNLEVVCFEINAENNKKFRLAGEKNIMKNIDREAKQLAFAAPAEEVDRLFESQEEDFFFPGPRQQQRRRQGVATE